MYGLLPGLPNGDNRRKFFNAIAERFQSALDPLYLFVHMLAKRVHNESQIGRGLLHLSDLAVGLNADTRPHAPANVLATVVTLNTGIKRAVMEVGRGLPRSFPGASTLSSRRSPSKSCGELIAAMSERSPFDLNTVENIAGVRNPVLNALKRKGVRGWFR